MLLCREVIIEEDVDEFDYVLFCIATKLFNIFALLLLISKLPLSTCGSKCDFTTRYLLLNRIELVSTANSSLVPSFSVHLNHLLCICFSF